MDVATTSMQVSMQDDAEDLLIGITSAEMSVPSSSLIGKRG